jgi:hypothetical protein
MGRAATAKKLKVVAPPAEPIKLDFGCGPHKREGFQGVDRIAFVGVDHVLDVSQAPWPWPNDSVGEAHTSHFVEHLTALQRVTFINELYRVMVLGATCQVIVPHWGSCRAYGDPTHQWPPVSEFWFYYLSRDWRAANAPHTDILHNPDGFACNFEATWGYSLRPDVTLRNQEWQQFAIGNYKEVCQDIVATLKKLA